jgi:hypothetical protein
MWEKTNTLRKTDVSYASPITISTPKDKNFEN